MKVTSFMKKILKKCISLMGFLISSVWYLKLYRTKWDTSEETSQLNRDLFVKQSVPICLFYTDSLINKNNSHYYSADSGVHGSWFRLKNICLPIKTNKSVALTCPCSPSFSLMMKNLHLIKKKQQCIRFFRSINFGFSQRSEQLIHPKEGSIRAGVNYSWLFALP